jgi:hypothetical protein
MLAIITISVLVVLVSVLVGLLIWLGWDRHKILKAHADQLYKATAMHTMVNHEMQTKYFSALIETAKAKRDVIQARRWAKAWKGSAKAYRSASNTQWRKA